MSTSRSRPLRQRRWFFEVRDRKIYLIRNGEELSSFSGMKMGAIMDVTTAKEHSNSKGPKEADNSLLVSREAHAVARDS